MARQRTPQRTSTRRPAPPRRLDVPEHAELLAQRWELIAAVLPKRLKISAKQVAGLLPHIVRILGAIDPTGDFHALRAAAAAIEEEIGGKR